MTQQPARLAAASPLAAGTSYTQNFTNWPNLFSKPGIYRLVELATNYTALPYTDFQVVAKRESEQRAELSRTPDVVATVPYFEADIHDLAGLLQLGEQIWR